MRTQLAIAAAVSALALGAPAAAATITASSYSFDQVTDCGSFCYHDAGVFTSAGTPAPSSPAGELTDGVLGYAGWAVGGAPPWVGWTDALVNIDFTFGASHTFNSVSVGSTQDNISDVVLPNLNIFSSTNGLTWMFQGTLITPRSSANDNNSGSTEPHVFLTVDNLDFTAPYVRVQLASNCCFMFIDEVRFAGDNVVAPPGVPEPASWVMMLTGFFGAGAYLRRRRVVAA